MEGHLLALKQVDAGEGFIEGTPTRSGNPMCIMEMLRSIDADANPDVPFLEQVAPLRRDQHSVGLERMPKLQRGGSHLLDGGERGFVKGHRHYQRFACMPNNGEPLAGPTRCKNLLEQRCEDALRDHGRHVPLRQITVAAINIAERCWLHYQGFEQRN